MTETLNDWVERCNAPGADVDALVRDREDDTLESLVREVFGAADYKRGAFTLSVLAETRWFKRATKVLATKSQETIAVDDMRWGAADHAEQARTLVQEFLHAYACRHRGTWYHCRCRDKFAEVEGLVADGLASRAKQPSGPKP